MTRLATPITLPSKRAPIRCALTEVPGATAGVVMVGGGDGGLDGPAEAIYPTLAEDLAALGIATLRVDFRIHQFPGDVDEGVHDLLAGVDALAERGIDRIGVLGHSFGGAVVIEAAARDPRIASVVTLASQTAGADPRRRGRSAPAAPDPRPRRRSPQARSLAPPLPPRRRTEAPRTPRGRHPLPSPAPRGRPHPRPRLVRDDATLDE